MAVDVDDLLRCVIANALDIADQRAATRAVTEERQRLIAWANAQRDKRQGDGSYSRGQRVILESLIAMLAGEQT